MKRLPYLLAGVLLFLAHALGQGRDDPPAGPVEVLRAALLEQAGRLDELEGRLAGDEADLQSVRGALARIAADLDELEAGGEPDPPTGSWPAADPVSVVLRLSGATPELLSLPPPTDWTVEPGWRHATAWSSLADLHVRAWWEQTERGDSWITVQVVNGYEDRGPVEVSSLRVSAGRQVILERGPFPLPPRFAAPWATTRPATAAGWDWMTDPRPFPAWSEARAQAELAARAPNVLLGTWPYWWHDGTGADRSPRDPYAPAGYGVAPGDGGADDWITGPWGKAARYGWFLGESWKPVWFLNRESGEPELRTGIGYWTGREPQTGQQGRDLALAGYQYTPIGVAQVTLETLGRPSDGPHFRRSWGGGAAIAPWSAPARWGARMAALDVLQDWHLDPAESSQGNILLGGLTRRIAQAASGYLAPPRPNGLLGSRYLAQAIYCLVEARPYLEPALWDEYARAFVVFGALLTSPDGVSNRDTGGDVGQYTGAPWNLRGPLCSTFHARLVCGAYLLLGGCGLPDATAIGQRMAAFLGPDPTPYAVEAWQAGAPRDRWQDRRHSAVSSVPAELRRWSPDGGSYASFTHGTLGGWSSLEELDRDARAATLEENPLAVVPRSAWEELYR